MIPALKASCADKLFEIYPNYKSLPSIPPFDINILWFCGKFRSLQQVFINRQDGLHKALPESWAEIASIIADKNITRFHFDFGKHIPNTPEKWQGFCDAIKTINPTTLGTTTQFFERASSLRPPHKT